MRNDESRKSRSTSDDAKPSEPSKPPRRIVGEQLARRSSGIPLGLLAPAANPASPLVNNERVGAGRLEHNKRAVIAPPALAVL